MTFSFRAELRIRDGKKSSPARDCKELFAENPELTDGFYWVDPDGNMLLFSVLIVISTFQLQLSYTKLLCSNSLNGGFCNMDVCCNKRRNFPCQMATALWAVLCVLKTNIIYYSIFENDNAPSASFVVGIFCFRFACLSFLLWII